jgi:hypothetical protein
VGFERTAKSFRLQFSDGKYDGLEVVMRSLSTGRFLEVTELAVTVQQENLAKAAGEVRKLFEAASESLASWNLTDGGEPVPATLAGLLAQDFDFVLDVVLAWLDAIASVAPPLPQRSNGSGSPPEVLVPMESLPPSRSS